MVHTVEGGHLQGKGHSQRIVLWTCGVDERVWSLEASAPPFLTIFPKTTLIYKCMVIGRQEDFWLSDALLQDHCYNLSLIICLWLSHALSWLRIKLMHDALDIGPVAILTLQSCWKVRWSRCYWTFDTRDPSHTLSLTELRKSGAQPSTHAQHATNPATQ